MAAINGTISQKMSKNNSASAFVSLAGVLYVVAMNITPSIPVPKAVLAIPIADGASNMKKAHKAVKANRMAQMTKVFPSHNMMRVIAMDGPRSNPY